MALNYLAPAPYAAFVTRNGAFQADANALISNVGAGPQALDLVESGCVPLAFNPFANFRNLIEGGDFSINPFQRNIPGLAAGGVIATPIGAAPGYFADRFFAAGAASSAILMAAVADTSVAGFNQSLKVSRQTGNTSLATINFGQVIETFDSLRCQGQTVTLSFWAKAGASYSGRALTAQVITGSGVNQSAASLLAGTWTTPSSVVSIAQALTPNMTRYQLTGVVPAAATQLAALMSFTPGGTAGADELDLDQRRAARDRPARVAVRAPRCAGRARDLSALRLGDPGAGGRGGGRRGRQHRRRCAAHLRRHARAALEGANRHRGGRVVQDHASRRRRLDDDRAGRDAYAKRYFDQRQFGRNRRPGDAAPGRRRLGMDHRQRRFLTRGSIEHVANRF